jgi:hypothetical protein
VFERCGANICIGADGQYNSHVNMILKFDENGKIVKQFGADQIVYPHGIHVDKDGNIWVADLQSNVERPAPRAGAPPAPTLAPGLVPNGNTIVKYSPDGKILMKMLVPGAYGTDNAHFSQPSDIVTAPNGDIFVTVGHDSEPSNNRIMKFDKTGKFIKMTFRLPKDIQWDTAKKTGNQQIVLFGDPNQPGEEYGIIQKWLPHSMRRPHFHQNDRNI